MQNIPSVYLTLVVVRPSAIVWEKIFLRASYIWLLIINFQPSGFYSRQTVVNEFKYMRTWNFFWQFRLERMTHMVIWQMRPTKQPKEFFLILFQFHCLTLAVFGWFLENLTFYRLGTVLSKLTNFDWIIYHFLIYMPASLLNPNQYKGKKTLVSEVKF